MRYNAKEALGDGMTRCQHCGASFQPRRHGGSYCSPKCRMGAWKQRKADRDARVRGLLAEALRVLAGEGE